MNICVVLFVVDFAEIVMTVEETLDVESPVEHSEVRISCKYFSKESMGHLGDLLDSVPEDGLVIGKSVPIDGCISNEESSPDSSFHGRIVVMEDGGSCSIFDKARYAQQNGALALVIVTTDPNVQRLYHVFLDKDEWTAEEEKEITIPVLGVVYQDTEYLLSGNSDSIELVMSEGPQLFLQFDKDSTSQDMINQVTNLLQQAETLDELESSLRTITSNSEMDSPSELDTVVDTTMDNNECGSI